jgi:hypothetical protein
MIQGKLYDTRSYPENEREKYSMPVELQQLVYGFNA